MNRVEFTKALADLLIEMVACKESVIIDYVKRSPEGQKTFFDKGLSNCDGIKKISPHQRGCAADLYFVENGKLVDPKQGWDHWHKEWERFGGKPLIYLGPNKTKPDNTHFEG